jgi:FAD/FMN-containing dehydrogenase
VRRRPAETDGQDPSTCSSAWRRMRPRARRQSRPQRARRESRLKSTRRRPWVLAKHADRPRLPTTAVARGKGTGPVAKRVPNPEQCVVDFTRICSLIFT